MLFDVCVVVLFCLCFFFLKSTILCSVCPPDGQRAQLTYGVLLTSRLLMS